MFSLNFRYKKSLADSGTTALSYKALHAFFVFAQIDAASFKISCLCPGKNISGSRRNINRRTSVKLR